MCTSYASKPARSNAAAISTWPLTPCSRRIATVGRTPVAMNGAAMSSSGSNVSSGARPGSSASRMRAYSWSAASGLSRSRCIACVVADHARWRSMRDLVEQRFAATRDRDRVRDCVGDGRPMACGETRRARAAAITALRVAALHLHDRAELLGEQCARAVRPGCHRA